MSPLAIATTGLGKTYGKPLGAPLPAVRALDLVVPEGSVFGLLGPNGAGKTTTIMMILGVIRPTTGGYSLFGKPMGDVEVRRRVGYVPEKFQLPGYLKATEFLQLQGRMYGLSGEALRRRVDHLIERVGLRGRAQSAIAEYSKGMQQRLALAQALLPDPDLVILDEPSSALDPMGRADVRAIIEELRDRGKTVLLNSHILSDVERVCDGVAILRGGRLERQGQLNSLMEKGFTLKLRVGAADPGLADRLTALGHNFKVVSTGDVSEFELEVAGEEVIPEVADATQAAGGRLYALVPVRESLEDLFMNVMRGEG